MSISSLVAAIKHGRKALCTQWRGSFLGLAAVGAAYVLQCTHMGNTWVHCKSVC